MIEDPLQGAVVGRVVDGVVLPAAPDDAALLSILKALAWPAFLLYETFQRLHTCPSPEVVSRQARRATHPNEAGTQTGARDGSHSR